MGDAVLRRRREYPVKGQDPKHPRLGRFPVPTTVGIRAGEVFVCKHFHRFSFRQRRVTAFLLEVDLVRAVGTFEDDSIS